MPNPQYTTAEQLATRHSLSLALDMPFKKLTTPGISAPGKLSFDSFLSIIYFHINQIPDLLYVTVTCVHSFSYFL